MRVLVAAARLKGLDGVSLEAEKLRRVLAQDGHRVFALAGELGPGWEGAELPALHFAHPEARALAGEAFAGQGTDRELLLRIGRSARALYRTMRRALKGFSPDLLVVQNAWAIPMHLALGVALDRLWRDLGVPAIAHNHDYPWERRRFLKNRVGPLLRRYFPPSGAVQLSINSLAQADLRSRRGLSSLLLPNVMDFDRPPPGPDAYNADFRERLAIGDRLLLLQPTRVVPRKRIEKSLQLAAALAARGRDPVVLVTHPAGDEGLGYRDRLVRLARRLRVDLRFADGWIGPERRASSGRKVYSLWDAYLHADLVAYPSAYEGFGNALLEAVWMRKPVVVGRYPVYLHDIRPLGFRFVEFGTGAAEAVERLLADPALRRAWTATNLALARRHFGYPRLRRVLREAFDAAGIAA